MEILFFLTSVGLLFGMLHYIKKYKCSQEMMQDLRASYQDKYRDPLTHLPNRQSMINYIQQSVENHPKSKFALFLIDLDHFKDINDTMGHKIGDSLIQEIASRLSGVSKIHQGFLAHSSGDTFLFLARNCANTRDAREVVEYVQRVIAERLYVAGKEILLTTSIGVALYPECGTDSQMLMKNVDIALYKSKRQRNTYSFYTEDMESNAKERSELLSDMRKAVEKKEFVLHYQPKIDITTGKITSAEALIRWQHPERGLLGPGAFIELAEQSGLIVPIGDWIIEQACIDTSYIHRLKEELKDIGVAVNLSGYQFSAGDVAGLIAGVLWKYKVASEALELELTESVVMENAEKTLLMLKVLKSMNVKVAVDDFGTGYSSLAYLRKFPINTLKIDQAFVRNLHEDEEDAAIVCAILSLAKQLKLKVVAEGVENREQLDFLREKGCDVAQGYFFSKPVPLSEYVKLLLEQNSLENKPF